ncbi:flagellar basal body rod protein FlgC [Melioribacter sp. OK-6-Me]|uniref:flagellar basal body rod protein FlgC n=1 Tax=unclassified Melioribacter TaxID=2627329 RepID=UPI003ED91593
MKLSGSMFGLSISARGMSIQRKKMELISQNIANADTVRTIDGQPYQRQFLQVRQEQNSFASRLKLEEGELIRLNTTNPNHLVRENGYSVGLPPVNNDVEVNVTTDSRPGDLVYMPDNPDADENGYVRLSNVNIINEMVDMIAATRAYEANLTALNSSKQMIKDSLEI